MGVDPGAWWSRLSQAVAVLLLMTSAVAHAQPTAPLPFVLKQVGPGVYAAIDGPKGESGSNAGFVIGGDGVLVIDSFFNPDATKALIGEIRKITPKPIRYLVETHYHIDHTAGGQVLRDAGAVIIAHRNERAWLRTDNINLLGSHVTPALRQTVATLALPDITTRHRMTVWLGEREVRIEPAIGHTGGDLMVDVPDAKVLFCGDILWNHVAPNVIDGTVSDWIKTASRLADSTQTSDTTFVPGHGDVATRKDVAAFAGYLGDLRYLVKRERTAGLSGKALVDAALPQFRKEHGDWEAFGYFAPLQLKYMDEELAGTKHVPVPVDP
jgi:glyoxylase-like metal-dependent hydrolase (beta-lactamase superfamily II)